MDMKEFKENQNDEEIIVNPNLKSSSNGTRIKVDPVELRGLKTAEEIALENGGGITEIDEAKILAENAVLREAEMPDTIREVLEQTGGELDTEARESIFGFDPIAAMETPPKPGKTSLKEITENAKSIMESRDIPDPTPIEDQIPYESDFYDDDDDDELIGEQSSPKPISSHQDLNTPTAPEIEPIEKADEVKAPEVSNTLPEFDDDDDDDEELIDEDQGPTDDEIMENLKKEIHEKISPIAKKFDISTFSIVKKPVRVKNAIPVAEAAAGNKLADWVLYNSGKTITMEGFLGSEIDTIINRTSRNNVQGLREQYNMLYKHDKTPGKPGTFEEWVKSISILDVDHLYAAAYRATFEGSNFIPYDCPNNRCKNSFLSDNRPFMSLVKFENDNVKHRFNKILNGDYTTADSWYASEIVPVSDTFAVSLRMPSIYDAIIKPAYIDEEFYARNEAVVALSSYIDEIFYIDAENQQLRPIESVYYPNNIGKTERARIVALKKIIKTLNSDQYNMIVSYISAINSGDDRVGVKYVIPETNCPNCGASIPEEETSALNMLFLRHRLAMLANG